MPDNEANRNSYTVVLKDGHASSSSQNSYETYIINMNERLQHENKNLRQVNANLTHKVEELMDEVGKEEKRNEYLKELLKNFNEIHKNTKNLEFARNEYLKRYREETYGYCIIFILCMFIPLSMWYITTILLPSGVYVWWSKNVSANKSLCSEMNKLKSEIDKIEKGQDYIYEFIDNC